MRRALLNFELAAAGSSFAVVPAPMGLPNPGRLQARDWLPSAGYLEDSSFAIREWLGRLAGA